MGREPVEEAIGFAERGDEMGGRAVSLNWVDEIERQAADARTRGVTYCLYSPQDVERLIRGVREYAAAIASLAAAMQRLVDAASGLWESERLDGLLEPEDDPYVRRLDAALEAARPVLAGAKAVMERVGSSEV